MKFLSLEPFVPSGSKFGESRQLFLELGFQESWNGGDYIGFEKDGCRFILQKFDDKTFAENLMISIRVSDAQEFYDMVTRKELPAKFGIRIAPPRQQPYGLEVNLIDLAGVCWHFVQ